MSLFRPARRLCVLIAAGCLVYGALRLSAKPGGPSDTSAIGKQADGTYFVPTGQTLNPAGVNLPFDGRPVDMAARPDGKMIAILCQRGVRLYSTESRSLLPDLLPGSSDFGGIAWSSDGATLYTTGKSVAARPGALSNRQDGVVNVTRFDHGKAAQQKPIRLGFRSRILPNHSARDAEPCGLALSPDGKRLYVSLFNNGTVAAVELDSNRPAPERESEVGPTISETAVGSSPETLLLSRDGSKLYVANRGGKAPAPGDTVDADDPVVVDPGTYRAASGSVSVLSTVTNGAGSPLRVLKSIPVGLQPTAMALSPNGARLFVANANSDTISVIDTATDTSVETIPVSPAPGRLAAASPNGLAVSANSAWLYVTLGGDNAVAVVALDAAAGGSGSASKIAGLIPTAWFPLGVLLSPDGGSLYVANSKGIGSLGAAVSRSRSSGAAMPQAGPGGALLPDSLTGHSVYSVLGSFGMIPVPDSGALRRMTAAVAANNHFDRMAQALRGRRDSFWARFKHVILVVKENRTYDQVFADVAVPPGHIGGDRNLLMFGEPITPNHHALAREFGLFDNLYCSGAISADGHHWLNEAFADDYAERAMNNYPRSYPCCGTDPLVFAGNKFLWQAAMDAGRSFQNYGEFDPLPSMQIHSDHAYNAKFEVTSNRNEDVAHCERIVRDIDSGKPLADLTTIWFPNDHTSGTRPGSYTPESDVADNDRAVGMLIDCLSHSAKYWRDEPTAVFIVEDDAQGGLDHVEGHRTVGLVVSPFNRRGQIVSTNFNQLNMVRTIEEILNIRPLNQFDAAALPMRRVFQERGDYRPYSARSNTIALNLKNPPLKQVAGEARHWEAVSATLDFSAPDRADPEKLTEILWHHARGAAPYPPSDAAR